jgi:hypothetical protein
MVLKNYDKSRYGSSEDPQDIEKEVGHYGKPLSKITSSEAKYLLDTFQARKEDIGYLIDVATSGWMYR